MIFLKYVNYSVIFLLLLAASWTSGCQSGNSEIAHIHKICIKASEEKIGKNRGAEKYCDCAVPYLYDYFKDDPDKMKKFADGDFDHINNTTAPDFVSFLDNCVLENIDFNPASMEDHITPEQEESIRFSVTYEMEEDFKATHNPVAFCDCYIDRIKKFSMKEFYDPKLASTQKYKEMMKVCGQLSLTK